MEATVHQNSIKERIIVARNFLVELEKHSSGLTVSDIARILPEDSHPLLRVLRELELIEIQPLPGPDNTPNQNEIVKVTFKGQQVLALSRNESLFHEVLDKIYGALQDIPISVLMDELYAACKTSVYKFQSDREKNAENTYIDVFAKNFSKSLSLVGFLTAGLGAAIIALFSHPDAVAESFYRWLMCSTSVAFICGFFGRVYLERLIILTQSHEESLKRFSTMQLPIDNRKWLQSAADKFWFFIRRLINRSIQSINRGDAEFVQKEEIKIMNIVSTCTCGCYVFTVLSIAIAAISVFSR